MIEPPNAFNAPAPRPKLPSNFSVLTFIAPCPSCGAPVEFASAGSVMAVCAYCQTTVIREGEQLKAQGKQSLTIDDYSPLQIGSVGRFDQRDFALVGRIQLRYEQGVWNEWYLQFADGGNGWLSEALGQYSISLDGEQVRLPSYNDLAINDTVTFDHVVYQVTDRRSAHAIAGEGELPYIVGSGWQTWVIDAQFMRQFITLDYSESGQEGLPIVYQGQAVELNALDMQLLKDDRQINASVGQAGGASVDNDLSNEAQEDGESQRNTDNSIIISKLECPNCGSPIPYIDGKTDFVICPTCHTESKLTGSSAEMVAMHSAMQSYESTLPLGAKARIPASDIARVGAFATSIEYPATDASSTQQGATTGYHDYVVIGIMRLNEVGEMAQWTEYLLYSLSDGFLWLSEERSGWFVSRVLSEMPQVARNTLIYDNRQWHLLDGKYQSRVIFAIGAFNWQVKVNDRNTLMDYGNGDEVITSEQTSREITYTIAVPLAYSTLKNWFGTYLPDSTPSRESAQSGQGSLKGLLQLHLILQVIVLLINGGSIIVAIIVAIIVFTIYLIRTSAANAKSSGTALNPYQFHSSGVAVLSSIIIIIGLLFSFAIGATSSIGNGSNATRGGGGIILIPSGGSSNSGRGGFSSGGSHK